MLGSIYGAKGNGFKEGAISLGIALQLTNILRDVFSGRATVGTAGKLVRFRDPKMGADTASLVRPECEGVPHGHR